ncbi:uncharacterized protein FPRO_10321 [Fusarium proliferatum ET1]|uniref:Uncharacterized protein n=1 Tax=Fusarium proliferatum (strain ET1) TaxID=1227346 RepID=A0A1L7VJI0_FUSPR|nr:uncharacterized protein FPRO_10321 [Fusarium proliferatum ET1]CZR40733.1 uncharacterized protein FPRO_10321 [Fusarium proliferatum ET1]
MDPFNSLPPEIRLKILLLITSKFSISSIIRASPTMLQQYFERRKDIRKSLIAADFDEEMMQDAIAIIEFPRPGGQRQNLRLVRDHLKRWLDKDLASPLTNQNDYLFQLLDDLHGMLLHFIQDYCSKATASYMPREYLCLQGVHSPSPTAQLYFRGRPIISSFNPDTLTTSELKRFFRAFLLYQLNCKVNKSLGTSPNPNNPLNNLPKRAIHPSEDEAIRCVHTYVRSMYGACIAQRDDGFLPSSPDGSAFEAALVFPDNFCFDPDLYTGDRGLRGNYHGDVTSHLAKLGLDQIAKLTRYRFGVSSGNTSFDQEFDKVFESLSYRMGPYQHTITRVEASEGSSSPTYDRISARLSQSSTIQVQICQQRAWVFFDNCRLYPPRIPSRPRFPTESFLSREADRKILLDDVLWPYSELMRSERRSQKWQDEYATRKRRQADQDQILELRQQYSAVKGKYDSLRETVSGNPEASVPVFEDPEVLREELKRMIEESTPCDLATVVKYVRYAPSDTYIVCRQSPRSIDIPVDFERFEGKTMTQIEHLIRGYLWCQEEDENLVPNEQMDFCFAIW